MEKMSSGMKVAVLIMMIGMLYVFGVTFIELPQTGIDHSKTALGFILGTVLAIPIGYYWGNSSKKEQGDTNA